MRKKDKLDQMAELTQELHRVRQESLNSSRKGDFRGVARLTCEAARLNRLILATEGSPGPVLERLGDKLFTSDTTEVADFGAPKPALELALAESA